MLNQIYVATPTKPLEVSTIITAIREQQEKYYKQVWVLNKVLPILRQFEGKKMSKRIETAVLKELTGYTVYYGHKYSWYELKIWGNGISYDDMVSLNLGYNEIFTYEEFERCSKCYFLNVNRYDELNKYINQPEILQTMVDKYNELQITLSNFKTMIPQEYPIYQFFKF